MTLFQLSSRNLWIAAGAIGTVGLATLAYRTKYPKDVDPTKTFAASGWIDLKLKSATQISPDTKRYVFNLKDPEHTSGLPTLSLVLARGKDEKGSSVVRPYSPISHPDQKGTLEFVIKSYKDGHLSKSLWSMQPGESLEFWSPWVKYKWEPNSFSKITLIGGGAGITPLYSLLNEITRNPRDKTKVDLYYACNSVKDILLKEDLDEIAKKHKDQVKIHYFVSKPEEGWDGKVGRINKEFLQANLPPPSKDTQIFVCGPPLMYESICGPMWGTIFQGKVSGILAELGYGKKDVHKL